MITEVHLEEVRCVIGADLQVQETDEEDVRLIGDADPQKDVTDVDHRITETADGVLRMPGIDLIGMIDLPPVIDLANENAPKIVEIENAALSHGVVDHLVIFPRKRSEQFPQIDLRKLSIRMSKINQRREKSRLMRR